MNILLFFLLITLPAIAKTSFSIQDLSEITYLYRDIDVYTRTPKEIEKAQLLTHDAVDEIVAEARKHQLQFPDIRFFHIDMKENKVLAACLEVAGANLKNVPARHLKKRNAGKYLVIEYEGEPEDANFGKDIIPFLDKNNLKIKSWDAFQYKKSAIPSGMVKVFYLPVEAK